MWITAIVILMIIVAQICMLIIYLHTIEEKLQNQNHLLDDLTTVLNPNSPYL